MKSSRPAVGLLVVDSEQLSFRRGLVGLVALLAVLVFVVAFGYAGVAAALGTLVAALSAGSGATRVRVERAAFVVVVGSLLAVVGVWSGERGWTAALVVGAVASGATLAAVYGKEVATSGFMLTLWLLLSLALSGSNHSSAALAGGFLVGGLIVVLLQPLLARKTFVNGESVEVATRADGKWTRTEWLAPVRGELSFDSPLLQFTIVRAGGLAATTLLGWYLFDAHPYWAAFVAFAITKSDPTELVAVGVHRAVGTIIGAVVAIELVRNVDSRPWLTVALIVAAALGIMFSRANYAIFTFFVTAVIVVATQLVRGDAEVAASQRVWATLLGVLLAFAITALVVQVAQRRPSASA